MLRALLFLLSVSPAAAQDPGQEIRERNRRFAEEQARQQQERQRREFEQQQERQRRELERQQQESDQRIRDIERRQKALEDARRQQTDDARRASDWPEPPSTIPSNRILDAKERALVADLSAIEAAQKERELTIAEKTRVMGYLDQTVERQMAQILREDGTKYVPASYLARMRLEVEARMVWLTPYVPRLQNIYRVERAKMAARK